ncbi:hypothetical protein SAMN04487969_105186 [Paenibacillus algorifonticola]|uniref:FtsX-like permease family protein n=1 Tax=Paenibacillus algorifonticola TaxID=684063 RepID=A0A1I2CPF7_9BACL|nr:hypothetical protein [Paenibacillus algorifonticola]SFE70025.1 hypothetical protein SAMN04487969_105186 [Paenibacillus algorifonticola]
MNKAKNTPIISRLILKKSNSYLRISILLFIFSLVLIASSAVYFINQYLQVDKDFLSNDNTHIIEITTSRGNAMHAQPLKYEDETTIREEIEKKHPDTSYKVFKEYQFNFGIQDAKGGTHFIYGLDEAGGEFLGSCDLEIRKACGKMELDQVLTLNLPIVKIHEDGLSSSEIVEYPIYYQLGVADKNPFSLYNDEQLENIYIGSRTYKEMIEKTYLIQWDQFVKEYDSHNPFGIQSLRKIYVYVDALSQVEGIAELVNDKGYNTNYTFKAFDNFDVSMKNTVVLSLALGFLILMITASHVILSFNSYLKVQQKDMGILKQLGYNPTTINQIYSRNINAIFLFTAVGITLYIVVVSAIFIGENVYLFMFSIIVLIILILLAINRIIVLWILRQYSKKNILTLLKINKEFE